MLQYLKIRNLALLDEVELDFETGFIGVTGETGAGKSVLLGALSLLSGARADKSLIRQGQETLEVEGILVLKDSSLIDAKLAELDLPLTEEGQLILRRSISREKAAKIHINGILSTLSNLQTLGDSWIDFHGPGEPQKLFSEEWQLKLLDLFAHHRSELADYRANYEKWRQASKERETLRSQESLSEDEQEFIRQQIDQIDQLELSDEKLQQLELDHNRVSQAQEMMELAQTLVNGLEGDEGVSDSLQLLNQSAQELADLDEEAKGLAQRLSSLLIEIQDISASYSDLVGELEFEPEQAEAIEERMDQWLTLKRKYGPEVSQVIAKRDSLFQKLSSQSDIEGSLKKLDENIEQLEKELSQKAAKLTATREKAARKLESETEQRLLKLGFKKARLKIETVKLDRFTVNGNTSCAFQFSPNVGQGLLPLRKIASSGELARVMLSLKSVLAKIDFTPVLVFDEVDSNVGGEIATAVGRELAKLGEEHQVFCITHLAQVASTARTHFVVEKQQSDKETFVEIRPIHASDNYRIEELARMIGDRKSKSAIDHARELLQAQ